MSSLLLGFIQDAFFAALAAIGFAMISNPPLKAIAYAALLSAIGHGLRYLMIQLGYEIVFSTLVASFVIGMLSIWFAHLAHCPPDVFMFPSLLPMIPGMFAYRTILGLIKFLNTSDLDLSRMLLLETVRNGLKATFILMALAIGVSLPMLILGKQSVKGTRLKNLIDKIIHDEKAAG